MGDQVIGGRCVLAERDSIQAFAFRNMLFIRAKGEKPSPCHTVRIERNLLTVEPPQFVLQVCSTLRFCPQVVTPYDVTKSFPAVAADEIVVHHAGGFDTVPVVEIQMPRPNERDTLVGGGTGGTGGDEATGRSSNLSFDEAFADALENLGPLQDPHPDQMDVVVVTEIRGEFGGIANLHDLVVTIRRE
ncbi:MAG: hypothetical protein M3441_17135 [Chloroflexota bacterium]|nr:hypothetical protein [Chloroflexota bacterium]